MSHPAGEDDGSVACCCRPPGVLWRLSGLPRSSIAQMLPEVGSIKVKYFRPKCTGGTDSTGSISGSMLLILRVSIVFRGGILSVDTACTSNIRCWLLRMLRRFCPMCLSQEPTVVSTLYTYVQRHTHVRISLIPGTIYLVLHSTAGVSLRFFQSTCLGVYRGPRGVGTFLTPARY